MWEIATKHRMGKLTGVDSMLVDLGPVIRRLLAAELSIGHTHALKAGSYPHPHGDPFDRMLAAQAQIKGLVLVSNDHALRQFGAEILW